MRRARIARDFASLSPAERARTFVLDPTREGRQVLTDAIRAELVRDSTLGERAMTFTVLESCGLTDAARTRAASYRPGTIVLFRKSDDDTGLRRDTAYRVDGIDPSANTLRRLDPANQAVIVTSTRWNNTTGSSQLLAGYLPCDCCRLRKVLCTSSSRYGTWPSGWGRTLVILQLLFTFLKIHKICYK